MGNIQFIACFLTCGIRYWSKASQWPPTWDITKLRIGINLVFRQHKTAVLAPCSTSTDLYRSSTLLQHISKTVMNTHTHTHTHTHTYTLFFCRTIHLSLSTFQSSTISDTFYSSPFPLFHLYLPVSFPLCIIGSIHPSCLLPLNCSLPFYHFLLSCFSLCSLHSFSLSVSLCQVLYWALIGSLEEVETLSSD